MGGDLPNERRDDATITRSDQRVGDLVGRAVVTGAQRSGSGGEDRRIRGDPSQRACARLPAVPRPCPPTLACALSHATRPPVGRGAEVGRCRSRGRSRSSSRRSSRNSSRRLSSPGTITSSVRNQAYNARSMSRFADPGIPGHQSTRRTTAGQATVDRINALISRDVSHLPALAAVQLAYQSLDVSHDPAPSISRPERSPGPRRPSHPDGPASPP